MAAFLEVWGKNGAEVVELTGERVAVGKAPGNDIVIQNDSAVSRVHMVLESVGASWTVSDVSSRNGTQLNGERVLSTRVLRAGDEMRVGATRLVFRLRGVGADASVTAPVGAAPRLTPRETELLVSLCRPVLSTNVLAEPASVREMANELSVSESAIKKLLGKLYDRFDLHDAERRRGRLVAVALQTGAVTRGDLQVH